MKEIKVLFFKILVWVEIIIGVSLCLRLIILASMGLMRGIPSFLAYAFVLLPSFLFCFLIVVPGLVILKRKYFSAWLNIAYFILLFVLVWLSDIKEPPFFLPLLALPVTLLVFAVVSIIRYFLSKKLAFLAIAVVILLFFTWSLFYFGYKPISGRIMEGMLNGFSDYFGRLFWLNSRINYGTQNFFGNIAYSDVWSYCEKDSDCGIAHGSCGYPVAINRRYIGLYEAMPKEPMSCRPYSIMMRQNCLHGVFGESMVCRKNKCSMRIKDNESLLGLWPKAGTKECKLAIIQSLIWDPDIGPFFKTVMYDPAIEDAVRAAAADILVWKLTDQRESLRKIILEFLSQASPEGKIVWWRIIRPLHTEIKEIDPLIVKLGYEILSAVRDEVKMKQGCNTCCNEDVVRHEEAMRRKDLDYTSAKDFCSRADITLTWWGKNKNLPVFVYAGLPKKNMGVTYLVDVLTSEYELWQDRLWAEDELKNAPSKEVLSVLVPQIKGVKVIAYYPFNLGEFFGMEICLPSVKEYDYFKCQKQFIEAGAASCEIEYQIIYALKRLWLYHLHNLPPEEASNLLLSLLPQAGTLTAKNWISEWLFTHWVPEAEAPLRELLNDETFSQEARGYLAKSLSFALERQKKKQVLEKVMRDETAELKSRRDAIYELFVSYRPNDKYYEEILEFARKSTTYKEKEEWLGLLLLKKQNEPRALRLAFETILSVRKKCVSECKSKKIMGFSFGPPQDCTAKCELAGCRIADTVGRNIGQGFTLSTRSSHYVEDTVSNALEWWNKNKDKYQ
jgi:hypothetical protein